MGASLFWGAVSASSLLIGAVLGVIRPWNAKALGLVLGFGAGALISGIAFQLSAGGFQAAGPWPLTIGLAAGALVFFFADRFVEQWALKVGGMAGLSLALGGLLDGIPEQAVLGIDLSHGNGVSLALLMAIFVSNLPESIGSSTQMHQGGKSTRYVLLLWLAVTLVCVVSTWLGYLAASVTRGSVRRARRRVRGGSAPRHARRRDDPRGAEERRAGGRARRRARLRCGVRAGRRLLNVRPIARRVWLVGRSEQACG